jgi:hypothetical protein
MMGSCVLMDGATIINVSNLSISIYGYLESAFVGSELSVHNPPLSVMRLLARISIAPPLNDPCP